VIVTAVPIVALGPRRHAAAGPHSLPVISMVTAARAMVAPGAAVAVMPRGDRGGSWHGSAL
jgi:hypothetical protein